MVLELVVLDGCAGGDDETSVVEVTLADWPSDEQEVSARLTPIRRDTVAFFIPRT